ncbi:hypothetical protein A2U01_0048391 [Trifolium medium]|uniref:Uncharacterized protein n=1 Tax=Trifolium medium TaxID=97028 RepID=A0A392QS36_9FABA|nr:hypothetical protein [Trifolium medium]
MAPSIMKNHMVVAEEIEESNDESKDGGVGVVIESSIDDREEVRIKKFDSGSETIVTTVSERLEAVKVIVKKMNEVHIRREQVITLEPPPEPPEASVVDQPVVVLPQ